MRSGQGSTGSEGSHTGRVTPARQERLRRLIPRALVVACLAGGTCAALATGRDHAAATEEPKPLHAAAVAHAEPAPPLPRQLAVVIGMAATEETAPPAGDPAPDPDAAPAPDPAAAGHPVPAPRHHHRRHPHHHHRHPRSRRGAGRHPRGWAADTWSWSHQAPPDTGGDLGTLAGATSSVTGSLDWHGLAHCEAGGRPDAVDPTGTYGGLYQFDVRTWHTVGGQGRPQDAPAAEQTRRAMRLFTRRGAVPWPVCGARLFR